MPNIPSPAIATLATRAANLPSSLTTKLAGHPTPPEHTHKPRCGHVRRDKPVAPDAVPRIVIFRRDTAEAGALRITAVFPCEPAMDRQMLGFTRDEGSMTCSRLWFDLSRPAKPEEYAALASYLQAKGNTLDIRHRITPAMDTTRTFRWEEEERARRLAPQRPSVLAPSTTEASRIACLQAAAIASAVTGVPHTAILPKAGELATPRPARWAAMFLAHTVFKVSLAEIGGVYGRTAGGVERAIRRVDDMRQSNGLLAALLARMERMAVAEAASLEIAGFAVA